jgi:hypothetical protein
MSVPSLPVFVEEDYPIGVGAAKIVFYAPDVCGLGESLAVDYDSCTAETGI